MSFHPLRFTRRDPTKFVRPPLLNLTRVNADTFSGNVVLSAAGVNFLMAFPTAAATIMGFDGGEDGQMLIVHITGQNVTFAHEHAGAAAVSRIKTSDGVDRVTVGEGFAMLIYNSHHSRWLLLNLET